MPTALHESTPTVRRPADFKSMAGRTLLALFDQALKRRVRFALPEGVYDVGAGDATPELVVRVTLAVK